MVKIVCLGAAMAALLSTVVMAQAPRAELDNWVGVWKAGEEQEITITRTKKGLALEGFATWGASDPERIERGGVHVGEFSARVPGSWIEQNRLAFLVGEEGAEQIGMVADDYACIVEMKLEGAVLRVGDNMMCGGMNVTFSGEYGRE